MSDERQVPADAVTPEPKGTGVTFGAPAKTERTPPTQEQRNTVILVAATLLVSAILGLLGDGLLRAGPWGLNILVFTALIVAAVFTLSRGRPVSPESGGFLGAALFFAAGLAWRDARYLQAINACGLLACAGLAAGFAATHGVQKAGFLEYAGRSASGLSVSLFGPLIAMLGDTRWDALPRNTLTRQGGAVLRGIVIAVPLLLLFGSLFVGADATFEKAVQRLFDWDFELFVSHAAVACVIAWLSAGFLLPVVNRAAEWPSWERRPYRPGTGHIEALTVLLLLDILTAVFVATQVPHLVQGMGATDTVAFKAFARRGYFEMLTATVLALPVLIVACYHTSHSGAAKLWYRYLAGLMVVSLFVMLASAALRLNVMIATTGLTELRLSSMMFLGWLAFTLAWFVPTVWRGRPDSFAFGALVAGFATIVALNAMNPDAMLVRSNACGRNVQSRFDAPYMAGLSADAVPALVDALPSLPESKRRAVRDRLGNDAEHEVGPDWRTWNWGRSRARASLRAWKTEGRPGLFEDSSGGEQGP